jgi:hypothetical protein
MPGLNDFGEVHFSSYNLHQEVKSIYQFVPEISYWLRIGYEFHPFELDGDETYPTLFQ